MAFLKTFHDRDKAEIYDLFFRIGMAWRIFYGFLRLTLGFILLRLIGVPLSGIFYKIMSHELIEDPTDFFVQTIGPLLQQMSVTITYFLAAYLIFWGIIDILLSINLLKRKLWAFPISICLIGAFVLYEIYRFSYTHSFALASIIVADLILIWLIKKEYCKLKSSYSKLET